MDLCERSRILISCQRYNPCQFPLRPRIASSHASAFGPLPSSQSPISCGADGSQRDEEHGDHRLVERDAVMMCCHRPHCLCRRSSSSKASSTTAGFFISNFYFLLLLFSSVLRPSAALVYLRANSISFTFLDAPARFAAPVRGSEVCGALHIADPIDACSPIRSNRTAGGGAGQPAHSDFVLIVRGVCNFENKVRIAQDAGYQAAIIYDDQEKGSLYSMMGNSAGIHIHAVFVSKMTGETLRKFAHGEEGECCIGSSMDEAAATVLIISFVSIVVVVSVLAAFLFARNCWVLRHGAHNRPPSMNRQSVEVLPCFAFKNSHVNSKHTAETCAICLEDYRDGETLRLLPCLHDFHTMCVDSWLTKGGTFCPVCKHEMSSGA